MMMQSRLEERIIRSRSAIAKLSQRAEELQLEKLGINPNMSTTSNPRPSPTINTEYIPRISKPEFSDEEAARKKLEARLAQISQLSQQTHASFPLQAQARTEVSARAEGNFIFVSEWDTSQTFMKDPAFTPRPPASPELQRDEQILSMSGDNSYDRSPQQSQAPTNVNFFRSVPGASEPRFYKGMIKPVEVFRGNPEVQKMYKTTTERLKESYAQEVAASLPRGAQSTADRMVGWHVALQVGLRVVAAASDHEESRGGAGMISRVDEEEHRCFVVWDATGVECGWYNCSEAKSGYALKLLPSHQASYFQGGSESRVTGNNSEGDLQARREAWEEENFFTADSALHSLSDLLLF